MAKRYEAIHLDEVGSTQDEARARCLAAGVAVMVSADRQTAGRGRSGSDWVNAPRAIAVSLAFSPAWQPSEWPRLALVGGLAARRAAGPLGLKWPNDLWQGGALDGAKVGGILAEAAGPVVVIGMGLNLWWPDAPSGVGALHGTDPGASAGPDLARAWAADLLDRAAAEPGAWGRDEYRAACVTLGTTVEWEDRATGATAAGRAVDVGPGGELVVETAAGPRMLNSAGVRTVRATSLAPGTGREPR